MSETSSEPQKEEKRGKKRTLNEIEPNTIDTPEPNPKRRKISTLNASEQILINDDTANNHNTNTNTNSQSPKTQTPNPNTNSKNSHTPTPPPKPNPPNTTLDIEMKESHSPSTLPFYSHLSIYTDERCLIHCIPNTDNSVEFNERPARLEALIEMVKSEQWNKKCRFIPSLDDTDIPSIDDIEGMHCKAYLSELRQSCNRIYAGNFNVQSGSDTYLMKQTFDAALISAGLVIAATKYVFSHIPPMPLPFTSVSVEPMDIDPNSAKSEQKNSANSVENECVKPALAVESTEVMDTVENECKYAVVLNRPPGHHCDGHKYSGYCYLNNTAVAIEKQLNQDTKVLILDIDVHHGDGTQKLFYHEPTVLTVSFHQYDGTFFPVSGLRTEYGPSRRHAAYGTNINIPLDKGASDLDVLYGLRNMVWDIVRAFQPDICYYACGTDGIAGDKANNGTIFTPKLYGIVASELRDLCSLIVVTTEGGYTTQYLSAGMSWVLKGLSGEISDSEQSRDVRESDVLHSTVHNIAATTSDLRRVYGLKADPNELGKIFAGGNGSEGSLSQTRNESMYVPCDGDFNESDSDERDLNECNASIEIDMNELKGCNGTDTNGHKPKKSKKHKHKKHRKKLTIDLTNMSDEIKAKKRKKHKKHKKKKHKKEKKIVSKTVDKKQKKNSVKKTGKDVINLVSDSNSPMAGVSAIVAALNGLNGVNGNGNGVTKKQKHKKRKKHKRRKKHKKEKENEESKDGINKENTNGNKEGSVSEEKDENSTVNGDGNGNKNNKIIESGDCEKKVSENENKTENETDVILIE